MAIGWRAVFAVFFIFSVNLAVSRGLQVSSYPVPPSRGEPWPMPLNYNTTGNVNTLDPVTFRFVAGGVDCDILREAFVRLHRAVFGNLADKTHTDWLWGRLAQEWRQTQTGVNQVTVVVPTPCQGVYPSLQSDESYELNISGGKAVVSAKEVWGALWGLETFTQLVYRSHTGEFLVNDTSIQDKPRFPHRGLLLDTSRHYLSKVNIQRNLDAMSQNKLNVFHWHIVDDQSFPYQSRVFPELSNKGAYYPETHIYTPSDIQEIVEFARLRGIRVVPEFDTPGHSQSWGKGQPDLLTKCYDAGTPDGKFGPINPTLNTTFPFLQKLFTEVASVFPDHYVHLGGDEVSFDCWRSNPAIKEFMDKMSFGNDYHKLEAYYIQKLLNIVSSLNRGYIVWQEVFQNGAKLRSDTVVEVWFGNWKTGMADVTSKGYKTLLAACWYLNYISYGEDWIKYYKCDPYDFDGTKEQKALVMGGELAMWGEFVDNTNVLSRLWPRASAVAERLWSPQFFNVPQLAEARLVEHRCRMIRRGIPAEPISGPGFCEEEY